eukprot:GHUV01004999.1.p1 GENE.GHUV01004999.1~~GHUV01004999.1.p1  ORF type:complete len:163 (+),score=50.04 GHUV01004999.1:295-783(+)
MPAPWQETPTKVVVEFLKGNQGARRVIQLQHSAAVIPPQLAGRVQPIVWHTFMNDIQQAADSHPYVVSPSGGRVGSWFLSGLMGLVLGCCVLSPDGGDYGTWLQQVQAIIARHQPAFATGGATLSLQRAQRSYWVQIDINPSMAVGQPVPQDIKPGFEPTPA